MSHPPPFLPAAGLALIGWFSAAVYGQAQQLSEDRVTALKDRLATAKTRFAADHQRLKDQMTTEMETAIRKVRTVPGDPTAKARIVMRLQNTLEQYRKNGDIPDNDEFLQPVFRYAIGLHKAQVPVRAIHLELCKIALQQNDKAVLAEATRAKEEFERSLGLNSFFESGRDWSGTRMTAKSSEVIRLRVGQFDGTTFDANLHLNHQVAGHPILKVKGRLDGIKIGWQTVQVVQGKGRLVNGEAYLVGRMMIGQIGGVNAGGGAETGLVVLRR